MESKHKTKEKIAGGTTAPRRLDLYLIHWPAAAHQYDNWDELNLSTWRAMTELYQAGKIRAIGVSNFLTHHIASLMETEVPPMLNQLEFHPGYMQPEIVSYCKEHGVLVEAWSPLGTGRVLGNETLCAIDALPYIGGSGFHPDRVDF